MEATKATYTAAEYEEAIAWLLRHTAGGFHRRRDGGLQFTYAYAEYPLHWPDTPEELPVALREPRWPDDKGDVIGGHVYFDDD